MPAALAAELRLLDEVLDGSAPDLVTTLVRVISEAALAVPSYLGLSVLVRHEDESSLELTTLDVPRPDRIGTSLRFTLGGDPAMGDGRIAVIDLVLYAAQPGALVDLAADLAWLTGRQADEFRLDVDLVGPQEGPRSSLTSWSTVNQARGVLMSGGLTVGESDLELDARAAAASISRSLAAADLLAEVVSRKPTQAVDVDRERP
jgi:hypothetical protein